MSAFTALTSESASLLRPVLALNIWTFGMEAWMYATRLPAISKYKVSSAPDKIEEDMRTKIPPQIKWKADNYNHLMEQPTQFYAVALTLALMGANDKTTVSLAWAYVGIRVAHSLVQATVNKIMVRFSMFATSSVVLAAMTFRAATLIF